MLNSTYLIDSSVYYRLQDPGLINNYEKHKMVLIHDVSMNLDIPEHELIKPIINEYKYHHQLIPNTSMNLEKP